MANLLWCHVFFNQQLAGILSQEPSGGSSFCYDTDYLATGLPAISYSIPLRTESYHFNTELPPFFDNLVAEGWLAEYQSRILNRRAASRFELLLAFGFDCIGAISVRDPKPARFTDQQLNINDAKQAAVYRSHASLSGVQPKLAMIMDGETLRPTIDQEVSTHIVKFASANHPMILINEYLTTQALKALLPDDTVAEMTLTQLPDFSETALAIKRFDRNESGQLYHFEEFNQLLQNMSADKYIGSYADMANFMRKSNTCLPVEIFRLFQRIVVGLLLGNTDMHLKNFALFHTENGLRLTPVYDFVAAKLFDYPTIALAISNTHHLKLSQLTYRHLFRLAEDFGLSEAVVKLLHQQLEKRLETAKQVIIDAEYAPIELRQQFIKMVEKRWNGTFSLIGKQ